MANGKAPDEADYLRSVERAVSAPDNLLARFDAIVNVLRELKTGMTSRSEKEGEQIEGFAADLESEVAAFMRDLISRRRQELTDLEHILGSK